MRVVLASKNKHKLEEISKITEKFGIELVLQSELGVDIDVEENGSTFEENAFINEDLKTVGPIVKKLADEFADVYIPLDVHFAEALKTQPEALYYSDDGVHPNANGSAFIGRIYAEAIQPLLK